MSKSARCVRTAYCTARTQADDTRWMGFRYFEGAPCVHSCVLHTCTSTQHVIHTYKRQTPPVQSAKHFEPSGHPLSPHPFQDPELQLVPHCRPSRSGNSASATSSRDRTLRGVSSTRSSNRFSSRLLSAPPAPPPTPQVQNAGGCAHVVGSVLPAASFPPAALTLRSFFRSSATRSCFRGTGESTEPYPLLLLIGVYHALHVIYSYQVFR